MGAHSSCWSAAKKMLALRWQPPHSLSQNQWLQTLLDIAYMEIPVAKMHNAKESTIYAWASFIDEVRDLINTGTR